MYGKHRIKKILETKKHQHFLSPLQSPRLELQYVNNGKMHSNNAIISLQNFECNFPVPRRVLD